MGVNSSAAGRGRRRYDSPLRDQRARQTRQAIVAAATRLFVARGYAATSFADIAADAAVARPTVFAAFGSKAALLREVVDQALAGDDEPVPVAERPWFRPVRAARTPQAVLNAYAEVCRIIGGRAAEVFEVVRRAADEGAELADLWETMQRNRRAGATMVIDLIEALEPGPHGLDHERAVDVVWVFNDPSHYRSLVRACNWSEQEYTAWIADQMHHGLGLDAPGPVSGSAVRNEDDS
ncbi:MULTISPECIES: TetR/AcrR family transcriptional regulator [Streptomyces]|jgi:AcrR family transcriptional regulator|uniref:TetR/AcrR family transcriptional regulator n=1 Tax=Streptomyces spinosisporus TaxID=2927582 RepID=A0ABS9X9X4_9ACTN|nr:MULTISPECIES: helix-turn-helix domain-containing protein [Streptomyces]MCI3238863.1 TetR/AcrR family transcriptional regulator [Streptomyces spinosisporus]WUB34760.1 TetR/AcrR family transcriptional regulator [Streptomyces sp. NBC_00588]